MPITQVCKMRAYEFGLYFVTCNLGAIENVGKHVLSAGWALTGALTKFQCTEQTYAVFMDYGL